MAQNAYTFTQKVEITEPQAESNFGSLVNDANHNAMTGVLGAGPQTVDISGTPVVSPATVSNSAVTTLTIPNNASQVTFIATTNTINISEADATVASKYFTIPTGVAITLDVSRCANLYLKANTGSATLSFWFNVV
jgi:hypothetical protein